MAALVVANGPHFGYNAEEMIGERWRF